MRLFLDECIPPGFVNEMRQELNFEVEHPLQLEISGLPDSEIIRGSPDSEIVDYCLNREMVIVTHNADDYRTILRREENHPGLIILPSGPRPQTKRLLYGGINYLVREGNPMILMSNHLLRIYKNGSCRLMRLNRAT